MKIPKQWNVRPDYGKENVFRVWDIKDNYLADTSPEAMDKVAQVLEAAPDLLYAAKAVVNSTDYDDDKPLILTLKKAIAFAEEKRK